MKNIILNNYFKKFIYGFGWAVVILLAGWFYVLIDIIDCPKDLKKLRRKGILDRRYQKFVYVYGWIWFAIILVFPLSVLIISLFV